MLLGMKLNDFFDQGKTGAVATLARVIQEPRTTLVGVRRGYIIPSPKLAAKLVIALDCTEEELAREVTLAARAAIRKISAKGASAESGE